MDEDIAMAYIQDLYQYEPHVDIPWNHIAIHNTTPDLYDGLQKITIPTLVIHGEQDWIHLLAVGEALAQLIPSAKLFVIHKAGHMYFNEKLWDLIAEQCLLHIREH